MLGVQAGDGAALLLQSFDRVLQGMMGNLWVFAQREGGQPAPGPSATSSSLRLIFQLHQLSVSFGLTSAWLGCLIPHSSAHNLHSF